MVDACSLGLEHMIEGNSGRSDWIEALDAADMNVPEMVRY